MTHRHFTRLLPMRAAARWCLCLLLALVAQPLAADDADADDEARRTPYGAVACEGVYPGHLQGIALDGAGTIWWSFTTVLVKTDAQGRVSARVEVPNHHGDLTYRDGRVYVAVNLGLFNHPEGRADNWIYVYAGDDLALLARHPVPEVTHGAGGIAQHAGRWMVVGGLPPGVEENYLYEYDDAFRFVGRHALASGYTLMGIQTAEFAHGRWWLGCYGRPQQLLVADETPSFLSRHEFTCSLGIAAIGEERFLVAEGARTADGYTGRLRAAAADPQAGLRLVDAPEPR